MSRTSIRDVVAAVAIGLGAAVIAAPPSVAADQGYYWEWSDGSERTSRTFTQSEYGVQSTLPRIVVTAEPARPGQGVILQFLRNGQWTTETTARTNASGVAVLTIDPFCSTDTWCDRTLSYRLKAGAQTARLTITYSPT